MLSVEKAIRLNEVVKEESIIVAKETESKRG
jgi:hypothetical protein